MEQISRDFERLMTGKNILQPGTEKVKIQKLKKHVSVEYLHTLTNTKCLWRSVLCTDVKTHTDISDLLKCVTAQTSDILKHSSCERKHLSDIWFKN